MCNVCVADMVLEHGTRGYEAFWEDAPNGTPGLVMRAKAAGAEFRPGTYQVKVAGDPWPKKWQRTADLAGTVGHYGMDVVWSMVPDRTKKMLEAKRAHQSRRRE
jgi:hypothetical protein